MKRVLLIAFLAALPLFAQEKISLEKRVSPKPSGAQGGIPYASSTTTIGWIAHATGLQCLKQTDDAPPEWGACTGSGTVTSISTTAPVTGCSSPCTATATLGISSFAGAGPGAVPDASGAGAGSFLAKTGSWTVPAGTGVTSVATTAPITGGTITGTGTIAISSFAGSGPGAVPDASGAGAGTFLDKSGVWSVPTGLVFGPGGQGPGGAVSIGHLLAPGGAISSYMTVPDNTALDATTAISISAWFKIRNMGTQAGIFVKGTASAASSAASCGDYALIADPNGIYFAVNWVSGGCVYGALASAATAISTGSLSNEWHHVLGTYNTSGTTNVKIYVDGVLQGTSGTYTTNIATTGTIGVVGVYFDKTAGSRAIHGQIDDLRIWKNVALTAADATALYNHGYGKFGLNAVSSNETVAWRFDEASGTTATDVVAGLVLTSAGTQPVYWVPGIVPWF